MADRKRLKKGKIYMPKDEELRAEIIQLSRLQKVYFLSFYFLSHFYFLFNLFFILSIFKTLGLGLEVIGHISHI